MSHFYEILGCALIVYIIQYCEFLFRKYTEKNKPIKALVLICISIVGLVAFGRLAFLSVDTLFDNTFMGCSCILVSFVVFRQFALSVFKWINNLYGKPKRTPLSDEEYEDLEEEQMELIRQQISRKQEKKS